MSPPVSIGMSSSLQSCSLVDCSERSSSFPKSIELAAAAALGKIEEYGRPHTDATYSQRQAWPGLADLRSCGSALGQVEEENSAALHSDLNTDLLAG